MHYPNPIYLLSLLLLAACSRPHPAEAVDASVTEAREDSLALVAAYAGRDLIEHSVTASVETASARADVMDDAADDPAIWVHPTDPGRSLVFGSNKTSGLAAYNLAGREVAYYAIGNVNNVDILTGVPLGQERITLLGASNRTNQAIDLYRVDEQTGALTPVADGILRMDSTKIDDVYGFCLGRSGGDVYAIVNGKNGLLQQFRVVERGPKLGLELVREVQFPSQTEGMVADDELGWLYVGEEAAGIWKLPLQAGYLGAGAQERADPNNDDPTRARLLAARVDDPTDLVADVEGLTLYEATDGRGYLVASMQGNFSYALFDRDGDNDYLGSFKIVDGAVDGVEETDGLEVMATPLPGFPGGLLVVQDGFNYAGDTLHPQNFKYVDFGKVPKLPL
ncbi:3-phytase [Neolewinella xylanilytica]|uniref:3-phytase n=1 Tax=Neolewinella xylanilytica TaxID=1514080 RepID=A0A2S6I8C6_9BACT|nr:phytase [Neolewinella xylanilytica]PPK87732.1 3-phytase [Neolewinella xylanilytica]